MTNEQVVVMVANYRNQLIVALAETEKALPEELRTQIKAMFGDEEFFKFEQTDPIKDLIEHMQIDIESLGGKPLEDF